MAKLFAFIVGVAGIVGAIFTVLQFYTLTPVRMSPAPTAVPSPGAGRTTASERPAATETPLIEVAPTPAPQVPPALQDLTPDPTTAVATKVILFSDFGTVAYSVTNLGWADDMRNVDYSLWAAVTGRLIKLDERQASFVAKGEYVAAENLRAPFQTGKVVVCVSYEFKQRRVSVIDFYTNEGTSSFQRQIGEMVKFRESVSQVDGATDLCKSMPGVVASLI